MATIDDLRLKILDRPQIVLGEEIGSSDGVRKVYRLGHAPVMEESVTIYVGGLVKVEGVDYTLDYQTGKLAFNTAPLEGDAISGDYEFAAFSDADLQAFLDHAGGNLALAAGEALTSLIADRNRLVTWSRGDARIDYDRLRRDLSEVARRFYNQGASESAGATVKDVDWEEVE